MTANRSRRFRTTRVKAKTTTRDANNVRNASLAIRIGIDIGTEMI
jgi:hypothetical protein